MGRSFMLITSRVREPSLAIPTFHRSQGKSSQIVPCVTSMLITNRETRCLLAKNATCNYAECNIYNHFRNLKFPGNNFRRKQTLSSCKTYSLGSSLSLSHFPGLLDKILNSRRVAETCHDH